MIQTSPSHFLSCLGNMAKMGIMATWRWPWSWLQQAELLLVDREHSSSRPAVILGLDGTNASTFRFRDWLAGLEVRLKLGLHLVIFFHLSLLP